MKNVYFFTALLLLLFCDNRQFEVGKFFGFPSGCHVEEGACAYTGKISLMETRTIDLENKSISIYVKENTGTLLLSDSFELYGAYLDFAINWEVFDSLKISIFNYKLSDTLASLNYLYDSTKVKFIKK